MNRLLMVSSVGMLALTVAGCGDSGSNVSSVNTPSASSAGQQPVVQPSQVAQPLVADQQVAADTPVAPPGLIQSTNPGERAKQVVKGRPDPFALLPGEAVPIPPPQKVAESQFQLAPRLPVLPTLKATPKPTPKLALKLPPIKSNAGSQFNPHPGNLLPPSPPISALPPAPQADLAKAILVTGVVQVGSEAQAIVKVPNEATSRYVQVGQRLSNGQVLVKRIEMNQGTNPVVILEQYGIEVAKAIGEEPAVSSSPSDQSTVPNSPTPSSDQPTVPNSPLPTSGQSTLPTPPPFPSQFPRGENGNER